MNTVLKKNKILKEIRSTIKRRGMTISSVSRSTNINRCHLSNIFRYPGNPSLEMTLKLLSVLGLNLEITGHEKKEKGILPRKKNSRSLATAFSKLAAKIRMPAQRAGRQKSISM